MTKNQEVMDIEIRALSPELLDDYLHFFDNIVFTENPEWSACYCYSFHFTGSPGEWNKESNRSAIIRLIKRNELKGYLAYAGAVPVGWCNANDRMNFQRLIKYYDLIDNENDKVCSIVCFLISPDFRRRGIAKQMLGQICSDYASRDYHYIEAYPGGGELSCERHYKGPLSMYEMSGFKIERKLEDYYIVRKYLKP